MSLQSFRELPEAPQDGKIFVFAEHPETDRIALVEADDHCAWLYLTDEDGEVPEVGVLLYNIQSNPSFEESLSRHEEGHQPPLPDEYASAEAIQGHQDKSQFKLAWSEMGDALVFFLGNEPWAVIEVDEKLAYSRAIKSISPYGHKWDQGVYLGHFAEIEFQ